ncbi:MAG: 16S rRNA (cytosine(967)-C(5))-methyltransferase RsmB [Zoogloeaceae bacterium]|nr:16S rRNA (cytosine(967)-C(5))-methyltransferase RsmB [Zoogloeaceae bacterium]
MPNLPPDSMAYAFWCAAREIGAVLTGKSFAEGFVDGLPAIARAAVTDLVYGALRRYGQGDALLAPFLRNPPYPDIHALLLAALYRLETREDAHTVVNQAVTAAEHLCSGRYKSLVNGVLRAFLRQRRSWEEWKDTLSEAARLWYPDWWIRRVRVAYPEQWARILAAGNRLPPMCLRVNSRKIARREYQEHLARQGIEAGARGENALLLARACPVDSLPGFAEGWVYVQDLGAQRAAELLDPEPEARVLDACAAPGGKTTHLLERGKNLCLTAWDIDAARCEKIRDNLARLGLSAKVRVVDATAAGEGGARFDAILADVPCSASGVVSRAPDVKWLRQEADLPRFAKKQARILAALWEKLVPRGKLLYATCSVFPEENERQIRRFLRAAPLARLVHAEQWLPDTEHDGFYYALLQKTA